MTEPRDPFEEEIAARLGALADSEVAPLDLAERAEQQVGDLHVARRRRQVLRGGGIAVLGAAAVWLLVLVVLGGDDDQRDVRTVDDPTTTTEPEPTTTLTTAPLVPVTEPTTTKTEPPPEPRCAEATGGADGTAAYLAERGWTWTDFYESEPAAADQPASIRACVSDVTPRVGQTVTVTIIGDDPDAAMDGQEICYWFVMWEETDGTHCRDMPPIPPTYEGYVKSPVPSPEVGHLEVVTTHVYGTAGPRDLHVSVDSSPPDVRPHPYGSTAYVLIPIVVQG